MWSKVVFSKRHSLQMECLNKIPFLGFPLHFIYSASHLVPLCAIQGELGNFCCPSTIPKGA